MQHSKLEPYFPENLDDYAPWVAKHGLRASYGECQCGCGEDAPIAPRSYTQYGYRKGHPVRYIQNHSWRKSPSGDPKVCSKCGEAKSLTEYYQYTTGKRLGKYHASCRSCLTIATLNSRRKSPEKYRATLRRDYAKHRERRIRNAKQWHADNAEYVRERQRLYEEMNPEKHYARRAVRYAVARGKFPPAWTMVCEYCQEALAAHWHHHLGYSEEHKLDVIAVCTECHGREHRMD